jgi:hypothetical protein
VGEVRWRWGETEKKRTVRCAYIIFLISFVRSGSKLDNIQQVRLPSATAASHGSYTVYLYAYIRVLPICKYIRRGKLEKEWGEKNRETGWNIWDTKMVERDVRSMCVCA